MLENIRRLLNATPFAPFRIRTADGREFLVPTGDHAWVTPSGRIYVDSDDGGADLLSPLLIASVRTEGRSETAGQNA